MKRWTRLTPVLLIGAFVAGLAIRPGLGGAGLTVSAADDPQQSGYRQLLQDRNLLIGILEEVYGSYYTPVDIHDVAISGIKGMMDRLDPYSEFFVEEIDESEVAELEITASGSYSGIGATIGSVGGLLTIIAPMKGSPAERSGLQAGDAVIRIDGQPSRTFSTSKAASLIKGKEGTQVTLLVEREGIPDPLEFIITRDTIEVNDVSAAVFAAPGIAYVEIGRFTKNTGKFLTEAIERLAEEQPVEGMILDLRGNPGGLLDEAVAVAEPFLPRGEMVVFMKGRVRGTNAEFRTRENQSYAGRLTVLVNAASASASEIIAGTMQDLDRGVVVGRTTHGKGLVQSVAQLSTLPGAYIRLTTAEYFTPSGRNLQRPFVKDEAGRPVFPFPGMPDTTTHPIFQTRNGRPVAGSGGVQPDIAADGISFNMLLFDLKFRRGMFLRYVNNYVNTRGLQAGSTVVVDEGVLDDFEAWCRQQGFTFETPTAMRMRDLELTARAEGAGDLLKAQITSLRHAVDRQKNQMWHDSRPSIALELRREFVAKLEGYEAGQLEYMKEDPQFQAALNVLRTPQQYAQTLKPDVRGGR